MSISAVGPVAGPAIGAQGTPDPIGPASAAIEPVPCDDVYALPPEFTDGQNISCGYLTVPARHEAPAGETYRLFTARLHATGASPRSEPLVWLQGGPGTMTDATLQGFLLSDDPSTPGLSSLLEEQDVILLDQRGIGASQPSLACPTDPQPVSAQDLAGLSMAAATPGPVAPTPQAAITLPDEATITTTVTECVNGLATAGRDLASFTVEQSADDIALLVGSVGGRADLYGVSWGSFLGQTVLERHPDLFRSAVLTSVSQPGPDRFRGVVANFDAVLTSIFAACDADPACAAGHPDLEGSLSVAVQRLNATPVNVPIGTAAAPLDLAMDGAAFTQLLQQLPSISLPEAVVPLVTSVAAGDDSMLITLGPLLLASVPVQLGPQSVSICTDGTLGETPAGFDAWLASGGIRPEIADGNSGMYRAIFAACQQLGLPVNPSADQPRHSDVPALLLTGTVDPLTPPEMAETVAETFTGSQVVLLPDVGHDPLIVPRGGCPVELVASFLQDPTVPVAATCTSSSPGTGATPVATPIR